MSHIRQVFSGRPLSKTTTKVVLDPKQALRTHLPVPRGLYTSALSCVRYVRGIITGAMASPLMVWVNPQRLMKPWIIYDGSIGDPFREPVHTTGSDRGGHHADKLRQSFLMYWGRTGRVSLVHEKNCQLVNSCHLLVLCRLGSSMFWTRQLFLWITWSYV